MLRTTALVVALATAAPALAQSALLDQLAGPPDTPAVASAGPLVRSWTIAEASAARERLADDILILKRIATLQQKLAEVNAIRARLGAPPLTLPPAICAASPLAAMCGQFTATFGTTATEGRP